MEDRIKYSDRAKEDLFYWKKINHVSNLKRIRKLLESILVNPYTGIGKPEALKYNLSGVWSRRINQIDRLVYEINESSNGPHKKVGEKM